MRRQSSDTTYRFGRFSAWPLGLFVFLLINAAAFVDGANFQLAVVALAVVPLLVWFRLRLRLTATHLEIRNLWRTSTFDLGNPEVRIWVTNGALRATTGGAGLVRGWGADGHPKSRNEGAVERLNELCFSLLQRTFQRDGATLEFGEELQIEGASSENLERSEDAAASGDGES